MPSDALIQAALDATEPERAAFLSAAKMTAEQVDGRLRAQEDRGPESADQVADELGSFAAGRIDPTRFAELARRTRPPSRARSSSVRSGLLRAAAVLREVSLCTPHDFVVEVKKGERSTDVIAQALGRLGRAFGAAELVELVTRGRFPRVDDDRRLTHYHPDDWRIKERALAPPLVACVPGESSQLSHIRNWLEGAQKLVLIVGDPCPPAPLVSLISPATWVGQGLDQTFLSDLREFDGPGVAAIVPEGCASWTHDPSTGSVAVDHLAAESELRVLGRLSVWRQREDLRQLSAYAESHRGAATTVAPGDAGTDRADPQSADSSTGSAGDRDGKVAPADRLAAWLVKQADLSGS